MLLGCRYWCGRRTILGNLSGVEMQLCFATTAWLYMIITKTKQKVKADGMHMQLCA